MSKIQRQPISYEKIKRLTFLNIEQVQVTGPLKKSDILFKRAFDLFLSIFIIVCILSWLLPILAILIKLDSRGPVFFVQKRVGAFGKIFNCYKLRTMYVNREAHSMQAAVNDPRITPLGKFLRLSCMDELPQFFNVLTGKMSIIGPRPHMLKDCSEFSKLVKHYNAREHVKPGITGMAQVKGYRGQTSNPYDVIHRYKWDMFYVKNCSFQLDIRILRLTVLSMISAVYSALISQKEEKPAATIYSLDTPEYLN